MAADPPVEYVMGWPALTQQQYMEMREVVDYTPIEAWISTMPMSVAIGVADWLQLKALHDYFSAACSGA